MTAGDLSSTPALHLDATALERILLIAREAHLQTLHFAKDEIILETGSPNNALYLLLEGEAALLAAQEKTFLQVDTLRRGSLLGLISFWTGNPSLTRAVAREPVSCLRFTRRNLEDLSARSTEFSRHLHPVLIANLCDRYRHMVELNLQVAKLSRDLEEERNCLQQAITELENTRLQLIHREKLATMGQLLAGIAHEINNPGTALLRNAEDLADKILGLFSESGPLNHCPAVASWIEAGLKSAPLDTEQRRSALKQLEVKHPRLPRALVRRLATLPADILDSVFSSADGLSPDQVLDCFETGATLRTIGLSGERILHLVQSLRRYGRPENNQAEAISLRDCIHDTLAVLEHRLKHYSVETHTPETPPVFASPGEINQILTNLLTNACDATPAGGVIQVNLQEVAGGVAVTISDSGSGIAAENLDKIFSPNFTTKRSATGFGLGLGLAISADIARKHGGTLTAANRSPNGAVFTLTLPTD